MLLLIQVGFSGGLGFMGGLGCRFYLMAMIWLGVAVVGLGCRAKGRGVPSLYISFRNDAVLRDIFQSLACKVQAYQCYRIALDMRQQRCHRPRTSAVTRQYEVELYTEGLCLGMQPSLE